MLGIKMTTLHESAISLDDRWKGTLPRIERWMEEQQFHSNENPEDFFRRII